MVQVYRPVPKHTTPTQVLPLYGGVRVRVSCERAWADLPVWHVVVRGMHVRVLVNGDVTLERDARAVMAARGGIALPAYTGGVAACTVYYDNIVVTPLD